MMDDYGTNSSGIDLNKEQELLTENTILKQEREDLQQQIKEIEGELHSSKMKLEAQTIETQKLKTINESQEKMINFYKTQPSLSDDDAEGKKQAELQLMISEEKIGELTSDIEALQKKIDELSEEKKEAIEMSEGMMTLLTEKEGEVDKLTKELKEAKASKEEGGSAVIAGLTAEEVKQLQELYTELQTEYDNYKTESENKLQYLTIEKEELQQAKDDHEIKVNEMESEMAILKEEAQNFEQERINFETEKQTALTNQKQEYMGEIQTLSIQVRELRASKEKIQVNSDAEKLFVVSERKEIEEALNSTREAKQELEREFANYKEAKGRELVAATDKIKNELEMKVREYISLNETKERIEARIDLLKKDIDLKDAQIASFDKKLKELKAKADEEKVGYEKKIKEMSVKYEVDKSGFQTKIKELTTKNEELTKSIEEKDKELAKGQNMNLGNLMDDKVVLKTQEEIYKEERDEQIKLVAQLRQEVKYYEKINNELKGKVTNTNPDKLTAENEFLTTNYNALKKQLEALEITHAKDIERYTKEIREAYDAAGLAKCQLAGITFEKDSEIVMLHGKYKRLTKKLQTMGFSLSTAKKK